MRTTKQDLLHGGSLVKSWRIYHYNTILVLEKILLGALKGDGLVSLRRQEFFRRSTETPMMIFSPRVFISDTNVTSKLHKPNLRCVIKK